MPTYAYRCDDCGRNWSLWMSIQEQHEVRCDQCRGIAIQVFTPPLVNITVAAREVDDREARWSKDMAAYKRMRHDGLQPRGIDGCAEIEARANTETEVSMGKILPFSKVREGQARSAEILGQDMADA